MSDEERFKKAIKNIKNNYKQIEQSKVNQLYLEQDLHPTTIGTAREEIWGEIFEGLIPCLLYTSLCRLGYPNSRIRRPVR